MRLRLPALAGLAFAALLLAPAAQAAHDPDWQGWFFQLDGALVTPGNTNTATFAQGPSALGGGLLGFETEVDWVDWDDDVALRGSIGYSFGSMGAIRVSYWTYDDTQENNGTAYDYYGANWFTVGPVTNMSLSYYYLADVAWDFEQTLEAEMWDLEYTRTKQIGNPLTLTYGAGIRIASFTDTLEGRYVIDPSIQNFDFAASRSIDSDGFGITGNIGAEYEFSDLFGISSNLRVGFLTSDSDQEHEIADVDGYVLYAGSPTYPVFTESQSFEDEVAMTYDFDINFTFHTGGYFDIELGYFYSVLTDMPTFQLTRTWLPVSADPLGSPPQIHGEDRENLSWGGPQLRVRLHL